MRLASLIVLLTAGAASGVEPVAFSPIRGSPGLQTASFAPLLPPVQPAVYATPAVVAPPTFPAPRGYGFRNGDFHAGHNCPNCRRTQYVISGHNRDGTHNHACTACPTVWRHRRRVLDKRLTVR